MAANRARTPAVMLGVGAVFDVLAGAKPHAPLLIRRLGFEWLFPVSYTHLTLPTKA